MHERMEGLGELWHVAGGEVEGFPSDGRWSRVDIFVAGEGKGDIGGAGNGLRVCRTRYGYRVQEASEDVDRKHGSLPFLVISPSSPFAVGVEENIVFELGFVLEA